MISGQAEAERLLYANLGTTTHSLTKATVRSRGQPRPGSGGLVSVLVVWLAVFSATSMAVEYKHSIPRIGETLGPFPGFSRDIRLPLKMNCSSKMINTTEFNNSSFQINSVKVKMVLTVNTETGCVSFANVNTRDGSSYFKTMRECTNGNITKGQHLMNVFSSLYLCMDNDGHLYTAKSTKGNRDCTFDLNFANVQKTVADHNAVVSYYHSTANQSLLLAASGRASQPSPRGQCVRNGAENETHQFNFVRINERDFEWAKLQSSNPLASNSVRSFGTKCIQPRSKTAGLCSRVGRNCSKLSKSSASQRHACRRRKRKKCRQKKREKFPTLSKAKIHERCRREKFLNSCLRKRKRKQSQALKPFKKAKQLAVCRTRYKIHKRRKRRKERRRRQRSRRAA